MDYYTKIVNKVNDKDIGLVVLNAGLFTAGRFELSTLQENQNMIDCNVYHVSALLKKFVPQLVARDHKAGLITVSSGMGYTPAPGAVTYAATKSLVTYLTKGL
jgi:uncharacterized protein